jgi:hypothetical protein
MASLIVESKGKPGELGRLELKSVGDVQRESLKL